MDELIARDSDHLAALHRAIDEGGVMKWRAFARLVGVSEYKMGKAWRSGDVPCAPCDCVPVREAVVAVCAQPHALRQSGSAPGWLLDAEALARSYLGMPPRKEETASPAEAVAAEFAQFRVSHLKAKTAHALQSAKAKEFELQVRRGDFVKKTDVELDAAECATHVIGVLQSLPVRLAASCAGLSVTEIEKRAAEEVEKAVSFIQDAFFTGTWS